MIGIFVIGFGCGMIFGALVLRALDMWNEYKYQGGGSPVEPTPPRFTPQSKGLERPEPWPAPPKDDK